MRASLRFLPAFIFGIQFPAYGTEEFNPDGFLKTGSYEYIFGYKNGKKSYDCEVIQKQFYGTPTDNQLEVKIRKDISCGNKKYYVVAFKNGLVWLVEKDAIYLYN